MSGRTDEHPEKRAAERDSDSIRALAPPPKSFRRGRAFFAGVLQPGCASNRPAPTFGAVVPGGVLRRLLVPRTPAGLCGSGLDQRSACPGHTAGPRTFLDGTASEQDFKQRRRPGNGAPSSLKASEGKGRGHRCVLRPLSRLPLVVSSTGAGGGPKEPPARGGAAQVRRTVV